MVGEVGVFQLRQLPATVSAGTMLRCWVEMHMLAVKGAKAEDDLTLELVCVATCHTSAGVEAREDVWPEGRVRRILAPYKDGNQAKLFEKGTHSFNVHVDVPDDCFPSVDKAIAVQNGVRAEFSIEYFIRCSFPSRDNPFSLDHPISIVQLPLSVRMLSPLLMQDRSPLGISVSVRANREQWHAEKPQTLFYSFRSPSKSDVPTILIEIIQKLALPAATYSATAENRPEEANLPKVEYENVVATFPLPPAPANSVSNYTIKLYPVPYLAPSMYLGPIDVDYVIRVVAVFPPSGGANGIVEFLATTPLNFLPASQELDIAVDFDDIDPTLPTDGSANEVPIIMVPPAIPGVPLQIPQLPQQAIHPSQRQFQSPPQQTQSKLQFSSPPPPSPAQSQLAPVHQNNAAPHSRSPSPSEVQNGKVANLVNQFSSNTAHPVAPPPLLAQALHHPPQQHTQKQQVQQHSQQHQPTKTHNSQQSSQHPPDSLEARLKRSEASKDVAKGDEYDLPSYSEQTENVVANIATVIPGAYPKPPPPAATNAKAYVPQQSQVPAGVIDNSISGIAAVAAILTPDQQRLKMQQEELERIKTERENLAKEAEHLREQERLRLEAEAEEKRKREEEAAAAERAKIEAAKHAEMVKILEEKKRLEEEKKALEDAERARIEAEKQAIERAERLKAEEEARRIEEERQKAEEAEKKRIEAEAKRLEAERLKAEEAKRIEDEKRRAEDERIEALRQKTNEARRQLELGKQELEEQEQLRQLEEQLEELKREKQIAAEKIAAAKALEDQRRQAEIDRLKRDAEIQAEKIKLQAELQFAKERAENEKLREEIERLKASKAAPAAQVHSLGNISNASSKTVTTPAPPLPEKDDYAQEDDEEPLQQRRAVGQFYKAVGLVREQTRSAKPTAPASNKPVTSVSAPVAKKSDHGPSSLSSASSPNESQMKAAYNSALESYRNRLFTHLSISGTPIAGREQTVARNDELMAAAKLLNKGGSKGTTMLSSLEAEMRVIESEILEDYENGLFQQNKEKILDLKETFRAMFDAGMITSVKELNEECKGALEGIKVEGDVSGRVYERTKAAFEESVKTPLMRLVLQREKNSGSSSTTTTTGGGGGGGSRPEKCKRAQCQNPRAMVCQ
ncbi:hypothetical protein HK100_012948 [Physocladia obscura]|uniref:Uncharacterized protein n=1 Tax=Physocladia obscura TaxID=109957 RepID=A0AAD5XFH8_9FUNG|nr:hypothetical protein HK100_012948 [Physocladia obscura]